MVSLLMFGHGSNNCHHPLRCVKCSGEHRAKDCPKLQEQTPTCCNCGGGHTANYRGCPYYINTIDNKTNPAGKIPTKTQPPSNNPPKPEIRLNQANYSAALTSNLPSHLVQANNSISLSLVFNMLKYLLVALSTSENLKDIMINTINSFITIFSTHV